MNWQKKLHYSVALTFDLKEILSDFLSKSNWEPHIFLPIYQYIVHFSCIQRYIPVTVFFKSITIKYKSTLEVHRQINVWFNLIPLKLLKRYNITLFLSIQKWIQEQTNVILKIFELNNLWQPTPCERQKSHILKRTQI